MSKKHFESLAKYVRAIMDPHARLQAACAVVSSCAETNPRFDTQKFFDACGVQSEHRLTLQCPVTLATVSVGSKQARSVNEPKRDRGIPARKAQDGDGGP